ncbi:DUF268 domain-containing protein [archaeon]|nr:MAG: DUF268 domain-containing protein [archaeon]
MSLAFLVVLGMSIDVASASPEEAKILSQHMKSEPYLNFPAVVDLFLKPTFQVEEQSHVRFDCDSLFQKISQPQDSEPDWPPPENIPQELYNAFTLFDTISKAEWYFAEPEESTQSVLVWSNRLFAEYFEIENTCGGYNSTVCETAFATYSHAIKGKRGLVIGSQTPWAEVGLLRHGAAEVITVEYLTIDSSHPQVYTMQPHELSAGFLSRSLRSIDFVFSFSSIEHDGLGRYGDPINPFGDLETMARIHCLLPPGGYLFLGVPTGPIDAVVWNAHRVYGRHRMRMLLQDWWEIVDFLHVTPFKDLEFLKHSEGAVSVRYEEALWILRKKGPLGVQVYPELAQVTTDGSSAV